MKSLFLALLLAALSAVPAFAHADAGASAAHPAHLDAAPVAAPQAFPAHAYVIEAGAPAENDRSAFWLLLNAAPFAVGMLNQRTLKDLNLQAIKALPAAGATNYSAAIDTANVNPGRLYDVELLIELPATPSLVDAKTITLQVQDSADGVTFANVADIPAQVATGAGGVGAAALAYQCKLPIGLRRYVRLANTVLAAGGDSTAISSSLSFVF